jgi:pimeloyl-ACP methyl ester carboxylesterase
MKWGQKLVIGILRAKLNMLAVLSPRKAAAQALKIFITPFRKSKKKMPPIFEEAERVACKVDRYVIRGFRWNQNAGKKALILHGFESNVFNFEYYIRPLISKGYEVLAFDAPAHGGSPGKILSLPLYVKTISAIYTFFGPIDAYISHSFGGLAITHFLEEGHHDPHTKLVLIAPATETTTAIDSFFRFLQLGNGVRKEFDLLIKEMGGEEPAHYSLRRTMRRIHAQTLWVHDENDELTPLKDAIRVKEMNLPQIQFIITSGLGHKNVYRDKEVREAIVEFL